MALPEFYDLTDPTSNLAGDPCSDPLGELLALMGDRLVLPPIIEENRIEFGERWALPLLVGTSNWFFKRNVVRAGLWTLAAYMAPLPVATALAVMIGIGATQAEKAGGLGEYRLSRSRVVAKGRRCMRWVERTYQHRDGRVMQLRRCSEYRGRTRGR